MHKKPSSLVRRMKAKLGPVYSNAERNALKAKLVRLEGSNFRRLVCDDDCSAHV
jgi:hypothetical protein